MVCPPGLPKSGLAPMTAMPRGLKRSSRFCMLCLCDGCFSAVMMTALQCTRVPICESKRRVRIAHAAYFYRITDHLAWIDRPIGRENPAPHIGIDREEE